MKKQIIALTIVLLLLLGFGVGIASAHYGSSEDPLPTRSNEEPPPRPGGCELNEWEQRVVERLALRYGVSDDEIKGWYCQDFSFGEIAIAYEISILADYPVEDIFAMLADGLSWAEIMVELGMVDELPPFRGRLPWPVPPFDYKGRPPARNICLEGDDNPAFAKLAEIYGLTYEQVYRWICGPFDYTNFPFPEGNMRDWEGWEYNDGVYMRMIAPDTVLPNVDLDDVPDRGDLSDIIQEARTRIPRPGSPRGRP